MNKSSF